MLPFPACYDPKALLIIPERFELHNSRLSYIHGNLALL